MRYWIGIERCRNWQRRCSSSRDWFRLSDPKRLRRVEPGWRFRWICSGRTSNTKVGNKRQRTIQLREDCEYLSIPIQTINITTTRRFQLNSRHHNWSRWMKVTNTGFIVEQGSNDSFRRLEPYGSNHVILAIGTKHLTNNSIIYNSSSSENVLGKVKQRFFPFLSNLKQLSLMIMGYSSVKSYHSNLCLTYSLQAMAVKLSTSSRHNNS